MKKALRGVLDGLRVSSLSQPNRVEVDIDETLKPDDFQMSMTVRHGFPYQPYCMAFDPVQHILAIGTRGGSLRLFGRPGVDCHLQHGGEVIILQVIFLINEGLLITMCSDDTLHLWDFKLKPPAIAHSLKFQRESLTCCHLSFQSKWLYIGTVRGNVHIANIETFFLSGYVINWNKAIELSRKTHPGQVVHLSEHPLDPSKLLIGFDTGTVVLWDLKSKTAEMRYQCHDSLRSISWQNDGKLFTCSHSDGSITTWSIRSAQKPQSILYPHAKVFKDGKPEICKPISKTACITGKSGDPFFVFAGGMPYDKVCQTPCLTVMHGKNTTVLEMEHDIIDFVVLVESPFPNDYQDPYGIVVLLENDLVIIDLTVDGYPCFENPYPMDIHESPVTACYYYADCPSDLIPAFYSVGSKQKKTGFSSNEWPMKGGEWGTNTCSYNEIVLTGHADGSVKIWDATSVTLQVLYKLKTVKVFERQPDSQEEDPYAIQIIHLDADSRLLAVAGNTHVLLFKFSKQEAVMDITTLDISIVYEISDYSESPEYEFPNVPFATYGHHGGSVDSYSSTASDAKSEAVSCCVKVRHGPRKWASGYQPELACLLVHNDGEPSTVVTSLSLNSSYGLLAFGNECGLAIVDYMQRTCLLHMGTPDLYGSMDPYQRGPRSPKVRKPPDVPASQHSSGDEGKSPTAEYHNPVPVPKPRTKKRGNCAPQVEGASQAETSAEDGSAQREQDVDSAFSADNGHYDAVQNKYPPPIRGSTGGAYAQRPHDLMSNTGVTTHVWPVNDVTESPASDATDSTSSVNQTPDKDNNNLLHVSSGSSLGRNDNQKLYRLASSPASLAETACSTQAGSDGQDPSSPARGRGAYYRPGGKLIDQGPAPLNSTKSLSAEYIASSATTLGADNFNGAYSRGGGAGGGAPAPQQNVSAEHSPTTSWIKKRFVNRMNWKMRSSTTKTDSSTESESGCNVRPGPVNMVDLVNAEVEVQSTERGAPVIRRSGPVRSASDRSDRSDGTFSRSRSSSMSSLENITKEAVHCLVFADSYTRKSDTFTTPCLWVGTSLGSVLVIELQLPGPTDNRYTDPVMVTPSGTIFRVKGAILSIAFLDSNGSLIPPLAEQWKDTSKDQSQGSSQEKRCYRQNTVKSKSSPTSSSEPTDRQFAIICSEKQARIVSVPTQACVYKTRITDSAFVIKADVVYMNNSVCLACYVANGHMLVYSLPSLRPLLDTDFLPLMDIRIARTFAISNNGHALFFCSPTEMQKVSFSQETALNVPSMIGDLFLPKEMPEAPKQSFFKNLFGGGPSVLDREDLFGEASGKAPKGQAKYIPGTLQGLQREAAAVSSNEFQRTRQALLQRGEKLGELDDKTTDMMLAAESYSKACHSVMEKYKNRKWYQL